MLLDLVDARDPRASCGCNEDDTTGLSADQKRAVREHRHHAVAGAPADRAGRGRQNHLMRALAAVRAPLPRRVLVLAPTGKAVDVAVREGAGDEGYTVAKALNPLRTAPCKLEPP